MSFILEALRKSENERQRLGNTAVADLPIGRRQRGQPWWVYVVGGLLIVNLLVMIAVLMRDRFIPASAPSAAASNAVPAPIAIPATNAVPNTVPGQLAAAAIPATQPALPVAPPSDSLNSSNNLGSNNMGPNDQRRTLADEAYIPLPAQYETVPRTELELANAGASVPDGPTLVRPTDAATRFNDTLANKPAARTATRDIHINLHVYSRNPRESFVLINMRRYMEGQRLFEGPTVEQITPEGVTLNDQGSRFQLSRNN